MAPRWRTGKQTFAETNHRLKVKRTARRLSAKIQSEFMTVTKS